MSPPVAVYTPGPGGPIQSHAWSGDRQRMVVAHGGKEALVYRQEQGAWQESGRLDQHDLTITSIDWAPQSNMIVTCSQDRNAYVWVPSQDEQWRY